jgi:dihydroorotate dehydrogenase
MHDILFNISKPFIYSLDPEKAHHMTVCALKSGLFPKLKKVDDERLRVSLWGKEFSNPVGLAAGFDKNAEVIAPMFDIGFGFVEVGTVTPKPQMGNPKPRLFRNVADEAVINRMGFPNEGVSVFRKNMEKFVNKPSKPDGIVGINIGMNKNQNDPVKDYLLLLRELSDVSDYLVVNVSSPNTPGLRDLQQKDHLLELLGQLNEEREALEIEEKPPILVKLAPDLGEEQQEEIAKALVKAKVDGIILTNTTLERPENLPEKFRGETGGLSGKPLTSKSTELVRNFYKLTKGKIPIIGVGGVSSGHDAYEKIKAGASLVQLYSAMVFKGPSVAVNICNDLLNLIELDGFSSIEEAVGSDHKNNKQAKSA